LLKKDNGKGNQMSRYLLPGFAFVLLIWGASASVGWENLIYMRAILQVAVPAMMITIVFGLFTNLSVPLILSLTGIPLGVTSSAICLMDILHSFEAAEFERSIAYGMLGLGYGLLISLLGHSLHKTSAVGASKKVYEGDWLQKAIIVIGSLSCITYVSDEMAGITRFWHPPSLLVLASAVLFTVNGKQPSERIDAILSGLVYGALACVIIGLLGYLFTGLDLKGMGPAVEMALLGLTYGGFGFFILVISAKEKHLDSKSITVKNWHLIEIYSLWVLMCFAPITLRETFVLIP